MTEQKKNTIIISGIAVLAVILAYCFRIIGRGSFYPMLFSYLRSFIYIGLFAAWGLSVRQRIVQKQVCRFMTVTAVLLMDNSLLAVRDINHKHIVVDWS